MSQTKALTSEQQGELKKLFTTYWTTKEKERKAKEAAKIAQDELMQLVGELPNAVWNGGTFRLATNVVRCYEGKKLMTPKKFDKEAFMDGNQEYVVTSRKINEELVIGRLSSGNEYLKKIGFYTEPSDTIRIEKS